MAAGGAVNVGFQDMMTDVPGTEKACRGRRCGRLLNLIGNWEEEEVADLHLATLGGGVRRFDD
jgi:hypothetical protein